MFTVVKNKVILTSHVNSHVTCKSCTFQLSITAVSYTNSKICSYCLIRIVKFMNSIEPYQGNGSPIN
uniref:Uncharacterized protein n=1 Tax=Phakopsora pachyrhizi TaxID=170000 RepID=A0A0S1MK32_PHAPC